MKYFTKVKSYEELKETYKKLLKENHPDNGGDLEKMQEINAEYDVMFRIWKERALKDNTLKEGEKEETAYSTRNNFYTANGWEGSNHNWDRSLKEVAKIVRTYVKEKYPTYKFSVRTSYASMCQELLVELKESPIPIYKSFEELTYDDFEKIASRLYYWDTDKKINFLNSSDEEKRKAIEESTNRFRFILNDVTTAVADDVDAFVKSYNYEDCDGQIDYFHVDFYYFGCVQNNGQNIKIVPKTARLKKASTAPVNRDTDCKNDQESEKISTCSYSIEESKHTKTGEKIFLVKWLDKLSRENYQKLNRQLQNIGGYYSRYTHSFIFKADPSEALKNIKIA